LAFAATRPSRKSEIRISKSETNPKLEERKLEIEFAPMIHFSLRISDLFRISVFEFRICFRKRRGSLFEGS